MSPRNVHSANGVQAPPYPVALASHEDVVKDSMLFMSTLRNFHASLDSKFTVPVIGGNDLNLHALYVEVTKRGGYNKVVVNKKWREISTVFDFSPTTTSASYALRKHYFAFLYRYEMTYFFRFQDVMLNQTGHSSFQAMGTIDGKIDCGYLVSIKVGDETLNGVLYHPDYPTLQPCTGPYTSKLHQPSGRRTQRRRKSDDPGHPKPNRSGYNFFFAEKHTELKSLHPNIREREFTKMIGESWNNLSQEEKMVYQNYGVKDKERYQNELKKYKEKLNMETTTLFNMNKT